MTTISEIYDAVLATCEAALPSHKRLVNAYDPSQNDALRLSKGFGVAVGAGENTRRLVGGVQSWRQQYVILITQSVPIAINDVDHQESIEKTILEAHASIKNAFFTDITVGGTVATSTVTSHGGINFIGGDQREMFLFMEITLEVEYLENPA